MAQFNEILEGQYSRLLQKKLGMGQAHPPSPQLSPEIVPTLELGNLDIFDEGTLGWHHYIAQLFLAASANINWIGLQLPSQLDAKGNPLATQTIAVIEHVECSIFGTANESALNMRGNSTDQAPTATVRGFVRDFRLGPQNNRLNSAAQLVSHNNFFPGSLIAQIPADALLGLYSHFTPVRGKAYNDELVIVSGNQANGDGYGWHTTAANGESLLVVAWWRERTVNSYELTV